VQHVLIIVGHEQALVSSYIPGVVVVVCWLLHVLIIFASMWLRFPVITVRIFSLFYSGSRCFLRRCLVIASPLDGSNHMVPDKLFLLLSRRGI
jgi:hypothetical protein